MTDMLREMPQSKLVFMAAEGAVEIGGRKRVFFVLNEEACPRRNFVTFGPSESIYVSREVPAELRADIIRLFLLQEEAKKSEESGWCRKSLAQIFEQAAPEARDHLLYHLRLHYRDLVDESRFLNADFISYRHEILNGLQFLEQLMNARSR